MLKYSLKTERNKIRVIQHKAYKYRIYPTPEQEELIERTFDACRFIYNHFLERRIKAYRRRGEWITKFECFKYLTEMKRYLPWIKAFDIYALRYAIKNMDMAYQNFFRSLKTKKNIFPKYKSKQSNKKTYNTDGVIHIKENGIQLPKLGIVKYSKNQKINGRILFATISKKPTGKYYVIICCKVDIQPLPISKKAIGLDVGIKSFAVDSNGDTYYNPEPLSKSKRKLAEAQRKLSRKKKGSKNYDKQRVKVAKINEKIANKRATHHHQLTSKLVKDNQVIAVEQLDVENMVKNRKYSKFICDVAWGEFYRQLEYKTKWAGREYVRIDRFYPSSQICHCCGNINRALKDPKVRKWTCPNCGANHDRDKNAAINILKEGLRQLNNQKLTTK